MAKQPDGRLGPRSPAFAIRYNPSGMDKKPGAIRGLGDISLASGLGRCWPLSSASTASGSFSPGSDTSRTIGITSSTPTGRGQKACSDFW